MTFLSQHAERSVLRILEDLGSSRALTVTIMIRHGEWDQLSSLEVDPLHYLSAEAYWVDAQSTSLIRKLDSLPTSFDKKQAAYDTFYACERQCLLSNRRLYDLESFSTEMDPSGRLHEFITRARRNIADILGPCPDLVDGRFGPGATFADRGKLTTIPDKMTSVPVFTPSAWPFLIPWTGTLWASASASLGRSPQSVPGNRFESVPKDSKRNRGIAIEPSINVFYQLGYGKVIRERLRRHGIYLDEGQDIHRRLARESSSQGHLATFDLSNASDTICRNLVKLLLPHRWFEVLDSLRSRKTFIEGRWVLLEKFSSMGNGFTFELETLIFLGLVSALSSGKEIGKSIFAYGDDLIFPTSLSEGVTSALSFFGLTVNRSKSFSSGPFRESCGGDYFNGVDVRPFFLKQAPDEPHQLIAFANGLRRAASENFRFYSLTRGWLSILDGLPVGIRRLRGPEALGDLVIHDSDTSRWQTRQRLARPCVRYIRVWRPSRYRKVLWKGFSADVTLASAVYGVPWGNGEIIPRDSVVSHNFGWVPYS